MLTNRLKRFIAEEQSFWLIMACVSGFIAVGKGMRFPNLWSATQAQVDYHFGFVKRGLFGEVIAGRLRLEEYKRFAFASWAILFVSLFLLICYTAKSHLPEQPNTYQIPALFFSSYGLTYFVNLVGYFDVLLVALAISVLMIANPVVRILAAIPVSVVAILIHELFLLAFVPVLLLSFLLHREAVGKGSNDWRERRLMLTMASALICVSIVTAVCVSWRASLRPDQAVLMQGRIASRVDFPLRSDFFDVMSRSAEDNASLMRVIYMRSQWWIENAIGVIVFAPTIVLLLAITRRLIRADSRAARGTATLATVAALSPLSLHLLALDAARWDALTVVTTYLVLLTVCRSINQPMCQSGTGIDINPSTAWRNATVLCVVLNIASGSVLLGYKNENVFPFVHSFPFRELVSQGITARGL